MELRDYLHKKRIKLKDFAALCGYHRSHIHSINIGSIKAGKRLVQKIEEITKGQVTRYDLLKNHEEKIGKV